MKIIVDSKEKIARLAAEKIAEQVSDKKNSTIAFAAGDTMKSVYAELVQLKDTDFGEINAFNICDYTGLEADDPGSCANEVKEELYSKLGIENVHTPTEENAESFDEEISSCGGLDLIVLGIGLNGHIGFNEPTTLYDSYTHVAQLTDVTKRMKAEKFGGAENVPSHGVTMGLKTICLAKNVILVAFGADKADIIHKLVYGKTSTYVPAAMLQMHMNMTLYLDNEAAAKL